LANFTSPISGAAEKIMALRQRHQRLVASIEHYEYKVAEQDEQLKQLNKPRDFDDGEAHDDQGDEAQHAPPEELPMTEDDLRREEEEIKELERKRRGLEERVNSMGKDITGVLR
jgi:chromosome segregation ATPase